MLYTDPSGRCIFAGIDTAACIGAAIGAGMSYGSQVYNNYQNGMSGMDAWSCVNVGDILIGAGAGAVAGAVGFIGFGAGIAAFGSGFLGTVGAGAFSGFLAGQYGRLASALLSGQDIVVGQNFLNPLDIVGDAALGGFLSGIGYGAGQALKNLKSLGQCSFSEDTPVTTEDGQKPISDLEIGDKVLAYNEETGETGYYPVTATWAHEDPVIIHLTIDGEEIETTPEHPFYTADGAWLAAEDLQVGAYIQTADGRYGTVEKIEPEHRVQAMYNLTVATAHTYFVGEGKWLVHNDCGGIRFAQKGISRFFRHGEFEGKSIYNVAEGLQSGAYSPNQLPIQVIERGGILYTMNNRSLMTLHLAEMTPTVIKNVSGNIFFEQQLSLRLAEIAAEGIQIGPKFLPIIR